MLGNPHIGLITPKANIEKHVEKWKSHNYPINVYIDVKKPYGFEQMGLEIVDFPQRSVSLQ